MKPSLASGSWLRDGAGILSANALNHLAAFVVVVSAARELPLEAFGALGVSLATVVLAASFMDFGSSVALVRLQPRGDGGPLAAAALAWKAGIGALWLGAAVLAGVSLVTAVAAALLGVWTTLRAIEQARADFAAIRRQMAAYAGLRLVCFGGVIAAGAVSAENVVLCLYVVPLAVLVAVRVHRVVGRGHGPLLQSGRWRDQGAPWRDAGRALLSYGVWVGVSAACFVALARLPLFALEWRGSAADVGLYSAALTFLAAFTLLNDACRTVLLPRVVRADGQGPGPGLGSASLVVLGVGACALAALTFAYVPLLGAAYAPSLGVWGIVAVATVVTMALGISNLRLHMHGVPQLDAAVNAGRVVALGALCLLLPPEPMAIAAAYASVLVAGEITIHVALRGHERRAAPHAPAEQPA